MSSERDILKTLLLKEELEVLDKLKDKLLSQEQFTQEVAAVLATAIKRANQKDDSLTKALSKPIRQGVIRAFSTSKQSIIDALLPIMGQLIRKTVANNIKQFVTDINRTIELGFSTKALKWRWQAKKAGISYPEMIFQKTIRYQVKELFLISRENGLLIEHVGAGGSQKDNNAISAMLSVIQDFIRDSFNEDDANLQSVTIQNVEYIFASGPKAYLASVVKGFPTGRLKEKTQVLIENVHADFSNDLIKEELYRNNTELNDYLSEHLITKSKTEEIKPINWKPWIFLTLLVFAGLFYLGYKNHQQNTMLNDLTIKAENTEGFFLQSINKTDKGYEIKGLKDPLADVSALQANNVLLSTKPYISLEKPLVLARINKSLKNYKNISIDLIDNRLTIKGVVTASDYKVLTIKLHSILGVESVDNQLRVDN